jgi:hypothetical protein
MPAFVRIFCGERTVFSPNSCARNPRIIMGTIESAIGLYGCGDERLYFDRLVHGGPDEDRFPTLLRNHMDGLVSTILVHIRNDEFRSFSCKRQGGGSADP